MNIHGMTTHDGSDTAPPLSPAMRAYLVETQRGLIAQANAARRLLGLPPVVAPDRRERGERPAP